MSAVRRPRTPSTNDTPWLAAPPPIEAAAPISVAVGVGHRVTKTLVGYRWRVRVEVVDGQTHDDRGWSPTYKGALTAALDAKRRLVHLFTGPP